MQWSKFRRFLPPVLFVVLASGVVLLFWASDTSPFDEYFEKATLLEVDNIILCTGQEPLRELHQPLADAGVSVH
ncbi:MAG: hypothetical protein U9Q79_04405, partial [Candidatus Hydrogenedentes bacterium]|nr:hypothetical protein [Candidatus Hydrogenedentota bacterium]